MASKKKEVAKTTPANQNATNEEKLKASSDMFLKLEEL